MGKAFYEDDGKNVLGDKFHHHVRVENQRLFDNIISVLQKAQERVLNDIKGYFKEKSYILFKKNNYGKTIELMFERMIEVLINNTHQKKEYKYILDGETISKKNGGNKCGFLQKQLRNLLFK